jgi:hypothetical protein
MKHLRLALGLALIPLCALLGSVVPIGTGSGTIIGLVLGVALLLCLHTPIVVLLLLFATAQRH